MTAKKQTKPAAEAGTLVYCGPTIPGVAKQFTSYRGGIPEALAAARKQTPVLGGLPGLLLPLAVVLFILIILHPYAPKVLNNVGFAYLTVACIDAETFAANLPRFFFVYIVGSLVFNGVCILLMKPAKALAAKTVKA